MKNENIMIDMKLKMKTAVAVGLLALTALTACQDKPNNDAQELAIEAVERDTWHYFSFSTGAEAGIGREDTADNALWFARTDWDMALNRYAIRTNSGAATSVGAQGGVYTFADGVKFDAAVLPAGAVFVPDKPVKEESMGRDSVITIKSEAAVVRFRTNAEGEILMPPEFLKAPVYAFRTADGSSVYKVEFTQYKNEDGEAGHVRFRLQRMD